MGKIWNFFKSAFKYTSYALGVFSIFFIVLSFTDIPYKAYYSLASVEDQLEERPNYIVIMGGDGMPSPSGLMRTYYGVQSAKDFPAAKIILALPFNQYDSTRQLDLMKKEFIKNDIDSSRIVYEPNGFSTRSQAIEIKENLADTSSSLLIVSSPEHMFRCIAVFKKIGFKKVGSNPSFEVPSDEDQLKKEDEKLKEKSIKFLSLRYNMWSYMQYEIIVIREYLAISYYWFKGWV